MRLLDALLGEPFIWLGRWSWVEGGKLQSKGTRSCMSTSSLRAGGLRLS